MLGHFRLLPFIAGLGVAAIIFLIYKPEKQIIRQYPHPSDADGKIFRDPSKTCYKYTTHEVNCDANEATLRDYPVQG
jgi:hypothetical protein